jgi:hypothetical protein
MTSKSESNEMVQVIVEHTYKIKISKKDYEAIKRGEQEIVGRYDHMDLIGIKHWRWDID